jgi:hypothetical protein
MTPKENQAEEAAGTAFDSGALWGTALTLYAILLKFGAASKLFGELLWPALVDTASKLSAESIKHDAAAKLFESPAWPASQVLVWIAFRELSRIGDDWCSDMHHATWYTTHGAQAPVDTNPGRTLLHALQEGKLRAIRDGEAMPPEAWFGATVRDLLADVMLRRSEALALWPEKKTNDVNLEALIRAGREAKGCNLTEQEAKEIAEASGELFSREKIREALKAVQGEGQRGRPLGSKNLARGTAICGEKADFDKT